MPSLTFPIDTFGNVREGDGIAIVAYAPLKWQRECRNVRERARMTRMECVSNREKVIPHVLSSFFVIL